MQKIDIEQVQRDLAAKHSSTGLSGNPPNGSPSAKDITRTQAESLTAKLWPMMSQAYGYKFASQFGNEPNDVWIGAMQGVTGQQIAEGLRRCTEIYREWPPGALQFRAVCLGLDPRNVDPEGNDARWQHGYIARCDAERRAELKQQRTLLEDKSAVERTRQKGEITLKSLKGMFS